MGEMLADVNVPFTAADDVVTPFNTRRVVLIDRCRFLLPGPGMVMLYNKSPIMWKSKMQKTTGLSTAEAEYYSASAAGCEVLYLRALRRLGFGQKKPTPIDEDNTACIKWGNNVIGGRERARHIDIRKHFAHEVIQNGEMRLVKVPTKVQLADILTKGLHLPQVRACVDGLLGRKPVSST